MAIDISKIKKFPKISLCSLIVLGSVGLLGGCKGDIYKATYEGHVVKFSDHAPRGKNHNGSINPVFYDSLHIYSKEKNGGEVIFSDNNQDGRFDNIELEDVRKGDPVEKYANLEIGQKILDEILNKK